METKNELLQAQTGVSDIDPKEIKKLEPIGGTPFTLVHYNDAYFIALGNYRLTELYDYKEDALDHVQVKSWEFLLNVISAIVNFESKKS